MCLFCKIVDGDIPSNKELEDENFIAFHDINPQAPIHMLVIPKKHVNSFNEVSPQSMTEATAFIQKLVKKLNIDKKGYRVITNIGDDGGQEVKHLHFHILAGTKLKWEKHTDSDPKGSF